MCVEGGRTGLHSPAVFPRLKKQDYLPCFPCVVAHVDKITVECHTSELGWFSLGSGGPFFLGT